MQVQGTVADVQGLGHGPAASSSSTSSTTSACRSRPTSPIGTWFRNSGTTQYGGHAHIVMPAVTGSAATGQASGAAGLVISYARSRGHRARAERDQAAPHDDRVRRRSARNTVGLGTPDPAQPGWDQHFGYGLPDLGLALERIDQGKIPPQALITSPQWFAPLNVEPAGGRRHRRARLGARAPPATPTSSSGRPASSRPRATSRTSTTQTQDDARPTARSERSTCRRSAPRSTRAPAAARRSTRPRPRKGPGDKDPNEPAFTVRVVVTDAAGNHGEDRKVLFDYRDTTLHQGWSQGHRHGRRGVAAPVRPERRQQARHRRRPTRAASSSVLERRRHAAAELQQRPAGAHARSTRTCTRALPSYSAVDPPREVLRTPAIGDIDGDMRAGDRRHRRRARLRLERRRHGRAGLPGPARPGLLAAAGPHARRTTSSAASRLAGARAT